MGSPGLEPTLDAMVEEQPPGTEEQPPGTEEQPPGTEEPEPQQDTDTPVGGAAAGDRTLCRSSTDKVISGVAGGLGAYFGIDAVIVRIGFVVLTFLGGAGPFLYLIGWLALPRDDSPSVVYNALSGNSQHRYRSLLAVGLIGLGLFIVTVVSDDLFRMFVGVWRIAPYLALILIAAGVALVVWPGTASRQQPTVARPPAAPTPPTAARQQPTATPHEPPPAVVAAAAASPIKARRGRSVVGSLTVAVLFVYVGGVVLLERLDTLEMSIGVFFAIAVAITGAGLLVSAYVGSARGLILLGVGLCLPLLLFARTDSSWNSGVGEIEVTVTDIAELQDEYRHGVGQMIVDLRGLELDDAHQELDLSLGIGEIRVYVPATVSTTADIKVGAGSIRTAVGEYQWGITPMGWAPAAQPRCPGSTPPASCTSTSMSVPAASSSCPKPARNGRTRNGRKGEPRGQRHHGQPRPRAASPDDEARRRDFGGSRCAVHRDRHPGAGRPLLVRHRPGAGCRRHHHCRRRRHDRRSDPAGQTPAGLDRRLSGRSRPL